MVSSIGVPLQPAHNHQSRHYNNVKPLTVRMYFSWAALLESRAMSSIPWAMVFLVAYRLVFSLDCKQEGEHYLIFMLLISLLDMELTLMIVFLFLFLSSVGGQYLTLTYRILLLSYCGGHPLTLWLEYSGLVGAGGKPSPRCWYGFITNFLMGNLALLAAWILFYKSSILKEESFLSHSCFVSKYL